MASPGILYVTMQPKPGLSLDQFHEWYNNEHGPTRLRLPQIFSSGLRYQATDDVQPEFLAVYDITSMSHLESPAYTTLREHRSPREADTIGQVDVKRCFYDLSQSKQSQLFLPIEQLTDSKAAGIVLVSVELGLKDVDGAQDEVEKWYVEEHITMLSMVPGWLRSRCFRVSSLEGSSSKKVSMLSLHEYAKDNGLGGPEHSTAMSTPRRADVFAKYITDKSRRTYSLFYVFGPAPRDLSALSKMPPSLSWVSPDTRTTTTPGVNPVITSGVTTADGFSILYQLEGNPSPTAPTVAFTNSLLTSYEMWDPLLPTLRAQRPDIRILRYDSRGRHASATAPVPVTLDMLADDLEFLLSALRVDKLYALVGVSMGGATTLKFALKYPHRLDRFIACDFNAASSSANTQAWKERTVVAESTGEGGTLGMPRLAKMTVERWFHPQTMEVKEDVARWMTDMVAANDVQGFKYSCQALWDYDMKNEMKHCRVPGLLVVGDGDGKGALVQAMDGFKGGIGDSGVELKIVPEAGHLPMCENPEGFWEAVKDFL